MGSPSKGFSVLSVVFYHLFPRVGRKSWWFKRGGGSGQGGGWVGVEPDKVHRRKFWFYDRRGRERNLVNRGL